MVSFGFMTVKLSEKRLGFLSLGYTLSSRVEVGEIKKPPGPSLKSTVDCCESFLRFLRKIHVHVFREFQKIKRFLTMCGKNAEGYGRIWKDYWLVLLDGGVPRDGGFGGPWGVSIGGTSRGLGDDGAAGGNFFMGLVLAASA